MIEKQQVTIREDECYVIHPLTHADNLLAYVGVRHGCLRILNGPAEGWKSNPDAQRANWPLKGFDAFPLNLHWPINSQYALTIGNVNHEHGEVIIGLPDGIWFRLTGQFYVPWGSTIKYQGCTKEDLETEGFRRYYRSPNGGNWSRVLAMANDGISSVFLEVSLTTPNRWDTEGWDSVRRINLCLHCTSRAGEDPNRETDELPDETRTLMEEHLGPDLTQRLLTEDFFVQIDWVKLVGAPSGQGGVSLADVCCD